MRENFILKSNDLGLKGVMRNSRFSVDQFIQVVDLQTQEQIGHVLDLNSQGLGVYAKKDLTDLQLKKVRLIINHIDKPTQFIDLKVNLRWCKQQVKLSKYIAGFEIDGAVDKKSKMRVEELIKRLSVNKESHEENNTINDLRPIVINH